MDEYKTYMSNINDKDLLIAFEECQSCRETGILPAGKARSIMNKLVQHIKMDMPGFPKQGLYCYGEASFEANQAMQEPLEKLYKYENQPDMREKVKEYIGELDAEIDRCMEWIEEHMDGEACQVSAMEMRAKTLMEVKNDLRSRLEELV